MTTRRDLSTMILGWLHRGTLRAPVDFDVIATFIAQAEADVNKDLRARCMVERVQQVVDAQYLPLPCDYIEAMDLRMVGGGELRYEPRRDVGTTPDAYPYGGPPGYMIDPTTGTHVGPDGPAAWPSWGLPRCYAIVGAELQIWPVPAPLPEAAVSGVPPDSTTPLPLLEMVYYARQTLGPLDTDTTKVLTAYPEIYLYAALVHSAPFVRDDARVQTWGQQYQSQVFRANAEHERARSQGSRLVARFHGGWGRGGARYAAR